VVTGDGVGQPIATQASGGDQPVIAQVERLGSEMLTKSGLTQMLPQELCNEVCEKQKAGADRLHAEYLAIVAQENAAMAE
jgi:hypothetical protein